MESLIKFVQDEFVTKKEIPSLNPETQLQFIMKYEGEKVRTQFSKEL